MSWRNLLKWKKDKLVREDITGYVRLAHTIEKQIFDEAMNLQQDKHQETELKMFDLLDLFMRDSSLGVFNTRLNFIKILLTSIEHKKST